MYPWKLAGVWMKTGSRLEETGSRLELNWKKLVQKWL